MHMHDGAVCHRLIEIVEVHLLVVNTFYTTN